MAERNEATQTAHPRRASLRTAAETLAGILLALGTAALLVPELLGELIAAAGDALPPGALAWALGALATVSLYAAAVTRILAIPRVNAWLTKLHLGAKPKHAPK